MRAILTHTKRLATHSPSKQSLEDAVYLLLMFEERYGNGTTDKKMADQTSCPKDSNSVAFIPSLKR